MDFTNVASERLFGGEGFVAVLTEKARLDILFRFYSESNFVLSDYQVAILAPFA